MIQENTSQHLILVDSSASMIPHWNKLALHLTQLDKLLTNKYYIFTNKNQIFKTDNLSEALNNVQPNSLTNFLATFVESLTNLDNSESTNKLVLHLFTDIQGNFQKTTKIQIIKTLINLCKKYRTVVIYGINVRIESRLMLNQLGLTNLQTSHKTYLQTVMPDNVYN